MSELTPPPERPLPDGARARLRGDLLAHAQEARSTGPRWAVPAGAAAAVAMVAGLSYWAISPGGHDTGGLPATGGGTPSASATPRASESSPVPSSIPPTVRSTEQPSEAGAGTCEQELENVLKGATLALQVDDHSSFYVKGERFVLCDVRDGATTITRPLPLQPQEELATYRVLSMYPPARDGFRTVRVAGGIVPPGARDVFDVTYTFPDGHVQHAATASDAEGRSWWLMAYSYDEGGGSELDKPPIEVTVSYSGRQEHYSLQYGVDTCAQANHGC